MTRPYLIAAALIAAAIGVTNAWAVAVLIWWMVPKRRKGW